MTVLRSRKQVDEQRRQSEKMRSDLEHMLMVQRRYTMRQLHLRQLKMLEILPASTSHCHTLCHAVSLLLGRPT